MSGCQFVIYVYFISEEQLMGVWSLRDFFAMEFESPDVEKDFPGLYASESGKRSQESDCE